ncbi:MAG: type II secretion system protein M [Oceanospirillaceae bacterium]|nr:type II secretion system protein M [Oceanospirillaceae bacterium]MCP5350369.1 type II secretion system protein M [Oceanospirillaceae bacterium]
MKMTALREQWINLSRRINRFAPRERILLIITAQVVIVVLFYLILIGPLGRLNQQREQQIQQKEQRLADIGAQIEGIKQTAANDPNVALRDEITRQQMHLAEQQQQIENITRSLVKPEVMGDVLAGLVTGKALRLQQLRNEPASAVQVPGQAPEINLLFRHDLSLNLQGSFNGTLAYIETIEQQPWKVFWQSMSLTTDHYPEGTLQLQVHTLSTSENVLGF